MPLKNNIKFVMLSSMGADKEEATQLQEFKSKIQC
jgi:hypothetical protein